MEEATEIPKGKRVVAPPTLVMRDKQWVTSHGKWNDGLMADYVSQNGRHKYLAVGELARVLGANTLANKERVRRHLSKLFAEFLRRGEILIIEYNDNHNAASALKVADFSAEGDRNLIRKKLDRMKDRKALTVEQLEVALDVICKMGAEI